VEDAASAYRTMRSTLKRSNVELTGLQEATAEEQTSRSKEPAVLTAGGVYEKSDDN
jgi:hypothetical protein